MTKLQAVRKFASEVAGEHVTIRRFRDDWGCCVNEPHPTLRVPQDLMQNEEGDKLFRIDFVKRCPLARGFANVTISVLHEIGHFFNREMCLDTDWDAYDAIEGEDHFAIPCEVVATDWAIEWLQDADNRKLAKAFEREFFGYGGK